VETVLVRPDLLGNALVETPLAKQVGMEAAGAFELEKGNLMQSSMFMGVCGGFPIR
jgi:hypothetical protein